ncbi:MAG: M67 family metallopeptidase [Aggregatilineales bacterium]
MNVQISAQLQQRIFAQLQTNYPNEGGGFLLGTRDEVHGQLTLIDARPVTNTFASEEQFHRYAMTPVDWARMEDEADAAGLTLVGYYHSHPDSPAIPSEYDRVHALPQFCYLITSVRNAHAGECRAWQLNDDRARFTELALSVSVA